MTIAPGVLLGEPKIGFSYVGSASLRWPIFWKPFIREHFQDRRPAVSLTSSSAVAKRPDDASCLLFASIVQYIERKFRFRFTATYTSTYCVRSSLFVCRRGAQFVPWCEIVSVALTNLFWCHFIFFNVGKMHLKRFHLISDVSQMDDWEVLWFMWASHHICCINFVCLFKVNSKWNGHIV